MKNAYDIDYSKLKESKVITDEKELMKLFLTNEFSKATKGMDTSEILALTGLDKSDLSRIRSLSLARFTIDRLISILDSLGYSVRVSVKPKKAS